MLIVFYTFDTSSFVHEKYSIFYIWNVFKSLDFGGLTPVDLTPNE